MSSSSALIDGMELRQRYYAKAKQFLYDHDRLDCATEDEIAKTADYLRYQDFRRNIEPYLKEKERLIGRFFNLQVSPSAQMPEELKKALAQWDELIAIEARNFSYKMPPDQP